MKEMVCAPVLERLLERLDRLTRRAEMEQLRGWLAETPATLDEVRPFMRFGTNNYLRNLVKGTEWYHLLVICWRSGQRSPIHNHAGSTCGLKVLTGVCTETGFEFTPCGLVKANGSKDLRSGDIVVSQDEQMHQVSNLQPAGQDLVTFHIYSPPLLKMQTYSLTGPGVEEFRPLIIEHSMGSGI